jgi:hypothetical protein
VGSGKITFQGTSTIPKGWTWGGSASVTAWPAPTAAKKNVGGVVTSLTVFVDKTNGNWPLDGTGKWVVGNIQLVSGTKYTITVTIAAKDAGGEAQPIATDVAEFTAP